MGEVDDVQHTINQGQPAGHQGVDAAQQQAVDGGSANN